MQDDPAREVSEIIESFTAQDRARREEEISRIGDQFSDRGARLAEAVGTRTDVEELQRVLEEVARSGPTDGIVVAAVLEKYGEVILGAAAEVELNPKAVAEELATTLGRARVPTPLGPFFTFDLAEHGRL